MTLPSALRAGLSHLLEGVSRTDLARRAARISDAYRTGHASAGVIRDDQDALAYAVVRAPATTAASLRAMTAMRTHLPDFAPRSILDLGAGPGSATFTACETWDTITRATQVERNPHLAQLSRTLAAEPSAPAIDLEVLSHDLSAAIDTWPDADLVVTSYVLVELDERAAAQLVHRAMSKAKGAIIFIEPGTPAGFARVRAARDVLLGAGAQIAAPCPGSMPCPMTGTDWCHFSVRLARSRDHRLVKGADAPFEDERFAYIAASRTHVPVPAPARVLIAPHVEKAAVSLKLCTPSGLEQRHVARSDKRLYKHARKADWGDPFPPQ